MHILSNQIVGTWLHAHEEDTATEQVYRRSDFAFRPSRGRTGYEFRPDHSCILIGISARDGATQEECTWKVRDDSQKEIVLTFAHGQERALEIVSIEPDRLVIKKT